MKKIIALVLAVMLVGICCVASADKLAEIKEKGKLVVGSNITFPPYEFYWTNPETGAEEIAPYIDAMNIDLKGFTDDYYNEVLGGSRQMTMEFIAEAVKICHVELTTLIVPGFNDSRREMVELASWVASQPVIYGGGTGKDIPLHVTRFFPRYHFKLLKPTEVESIYWLAHAARQHLRHVYPGNC